MGGHIFHRSRLKDLSALEAAFIYQHSRKSGIILNGGNKPCPSGFISRRYVHGKTDSQTVVTEFFHFTGSLLISHGQSVQLLTWNIEICIFHSQRHKKLFLKKFTVFHAGSLLHHCCQNICGYPILPALSGLKLQRTSADLICKFQCCHGMLCIQTCMYFFDHISNGKLCSTAVSAISQTTGHRQQMINRYIMPYWCQSARYRHHLVCKSRNISGNRICQINYSSFK